MPRKLLTAVALLAASVTVAIAASAAFAAGPGSPNLQFDGVTGQVEAPSNPAFSVATTGQLTVEAWMRPDGWTLPAACRAPGLPPYVSSSPYFSNTKGTAPSDRYVHWLGKGVTGQQEWAFRMYSCDHSQGTPTEYRAGRISFYVFNPVGGLGVGSYYQPGFGSFAGDPLWHPNEWIHVIGIADGERTYIYIDGQFKSCNSYTGADTPDLRHAGVTCRSAPVGVTITPQAGTAPLRMGHLDGNGFFQGALSQVRIWNRALSDQEIVDLHNAGTVPPSGLVASYPLNDGCGTTAAPNGVLSPGATWSMTTCTKPTTPPTISNAHLTRKRFRVGKHRRGTAFDFTLDTTATVDVVIKRKAHGRLHRVGKLTRLHEPKGVDSIPFRGRIGGRALRPGTYEAVVTATNGAGASKPVTLRFRIVRH